MLRMRNVICCWCDNSDSFETHIPLLFSGQRNRRLGFTNNIDLLWLSGYELLRDEYKQCLRDVGYTIHDVTTLYRELETRYSALQRFSNYERKCFLRWLIICLTLAEN